MQLAQEPHVSAKGSSEVYSLYFSDALSVCVCVVVSVCIVDIITEAYTHTAKLLLLLKRLTS